MDHLGHEAVEQFAALILVIGGAVFLLFALRSRRVRTGPVAAGAAVLGGGSAHGRPRAQAIAGQAEVAAPADNTAPSNGASPSFRRSLDVMMAILSAGAAVIHLVAAPSHYVEIGALAGGFVISAAFQGLWACWCLAGPSRRTVAIGIAGNLSIVAAWIFTRTVGLPIGEFAGSAEPVGYPDAASVVFELLLVAGLIIRRLDLDVALSRRAFARSVASIAVVPVLGLVLVLTSLATVAIASGLEHGALDGSPQGHMANH